MILSKNVKGQGMSTNTMILLILGVVILVVMILGFTMGWGKIAPFLSSTNVDDVVTSCTAACSTGAKYDFCTMSQELRDEEKNEFKTSCLVYSTVKEFEKYGIEECPSIDCEIPCTQIKVNEEYGVLGNAGTGFYDVTNATYGLNQGDVCVVKVSK